MRFLLGDSDFGQHVENRFTFDFQLSRQIVNSNLTHPPLCPSGQFRLRVHIDLMVSSDVVRCVFYSKPCNQRLYNGLLFLFRRLS